MFATESRICGAARRGLPLTLRIPAMILLAAMRSSATEYPYSVVPGGLPADHVLAHHQCLYLGMRFGGEMLWTDHCVWLKAGEKMAGTRRARCGNPTVSHLPSGAKTLPPGLHFLVPVMERPLPNIVAPPQTTLTELTWTPPGEQTQVPDLLPPGELTVVHAFPAPYFFLPAGGGGTQRCKHKPCRSASPASVHTPEPSSVWLVLSGLMGLATLVALNHLRQRMPSSALAPSGRELP